jgi:hypothetical protein
MSACRVMAGMSAERLWQIVTVASPPGPLADSRSASGRARNEPGPPLGEEPGILRVKAIDIAIGGHGIEHRHGVDVGGQRQLHENSVGGPLLVPRDRLHECDQRLRVGRCRHTHDLGIDPHPGSGRGLALHVGGAGRHVANEHDHQPGRSLEHVGERPHLVGEGGFDPRRQLPAVEEGRRRPIAHARASIHIIRNWC